MNKTINLREGKNNIAIMTKDISWIIVGIFSFFISRIIILDSINPISIAFLGNFINAGFSFYSILIFTAFGNLLSLKSMFLLKYIICLVILTSINYIVGKKNYFLNIYIKALISAISIFVSAVLISFIYYLGIFSYFLAAFEGILTFSMVILLERATKIIFNKRSSKVLSSEDLISISILFGAIITGSSDIYIANFSFKIIYCSLILLIVGHKGGSSLGATCGLILGLFLYFSGFSYISFPIILSIVGICCGIFKETNKYKVMLAFIVSGITSIIILDISLLNISLLWSCLLALLFFHLTPQDFYFNLNTIINPNLYNIDNYISHIKEVSSYRLTSIANTFERLSKTFTSLSEKKDNLTQGDISKLIDDVATKVCKDCSMNNNCWRVNFYNTYQGVFSILAHCENKGSIKVEDLPQDFTNMCIKVNKFVEATNKYFDLYKSNLSWHNSIVESRELISEQLQGVSDIIKSVSTEINVDLTFNVKLEDAIIYELKNNKINVEQVIVYENNSNKYEVIIKYESSDSKNVTKICEHIVSKAIGIKMKKENNFNIYEKEKFTIKLVEEKKYRVISGVAKDNKNGNIESGDSYSFIEFKDGNYLLALSDGMGSGRRANRESMATLDLLEDLLESGFEKELAIKMINSVLVLKGGYDSFCTLDACYINLYNAEAEFIKIGGTSSFILRENLVHTIKSSSLPIGMLKNVDMEVHSKLLKNNDMIVMVTDGILEISTENKNWILDIIGSYKGKNPQKLADIILEEAKSLNKNKSHDDMTVLVAKIWQG